MEEQKQDASSKLSDKAFDFELGVLVGRAITSGVNPIVVEGCLSHSLFDVQMWKSRNDVMLREMREREKAEAMVASAHEAANGTGKLTKLSDIIASAHPPAIVVKE